MKTRLCVATLLVALGVTLLWWGLAPLRQHQASPRIIRGGFQVVFPTQQRYAEWIRSM